MSATCRNENDFHQFFTMQRQLVIASALFFVRDFSRTQREVQCEYNEVGVVGKISNTLGMEKN